MEAVLSNTCMIVGTRLKYKVVICNTSRAVTTYSRGPGNDIASCAMLFLNFVPMVKLFGITMFIVLAVLLCFAMWVLVLVSCRGSILWVQRCFQVAGLSWGVEGWHGRKWKWSSLIISLGPLLQPGSARELDYVDAHADLVNDCEG